jgi:DNA-binding transcriptional LysR family regulator
LDEETVRRTSDLTSRFFRDGLKLKHLRMLAKLAELRQVSRVAQAFNVTQPAISKQIAEVAKALGTPIVQRQGNRLLFTPVGERLAAHAREVMQQVERARFDIDALRRGLGGRLAVGAVTSISPTLLPEAIRLLKLTAPPAVVSVTEGHFNQLLPLMEGGFLDLIIARAWQPVALDGIDQMALLSEPVLVVAGANHPLSSKPDITWQDALEWPWITPAPNSRAYDAIANLMARFGVGLPEEQVESTSLPLNIELMRIAPFVGLMPQWLAHHHASRGDLAILRLQTEDILSEVRCYWRSNSTDPTLDLFRECLEQASRLPRFRSQARSFPV